MNNNLNENNLNENKMIYVVFDASQKADGEATVQWLKESNTAALSGGPEITEHGLFIYSLFSITPIYRDSAIIFLSDEATMNPDWQDYIYNRSGDLRLIPMGRTENAKHDRPESVPKRIDQINYIRLNEQRYIHLLDALITDPEFYLMKNYLFSRYNNWSLTKNEEYLLSKRSEIRKYKSAVNRKKESKIDRFLAEQLEQITVYLQASERYSFRLGLARFFRWAVRGALFAAAVAMLIVFFKVRARMERATYANIVLGIDTDNGEPDVNAIKMVEAITNPYTSESARDMAKKNLVACLDKVWQQNVIGGYYRYELNDIAIPAGSRYLWTASSGGKVLLWDTYNGTIAESHALTDCSVNAVSVSGSGNTLAALDERGTFYIRDDSGWRSPGTVPVAADEAEIRLTDETAVVFDENMVWICDLLRNETDMAEVSHVIQAEPLAEGGVLIFYRGEEDLLSSLIRKDKGNTEEKHYEILCPDTGASDMKNGMLVLTDQKGQVWRVRRKGTEQVPLLLKQPIDISIVNEDTLAYAERNAGAGMYCISGGFDYGDVLAQYKGLKAIESSSEALVVKVNYNYLTIALQDILPADSLPAGIRASYGGKEYSVSNEGDGIRNISILENGIIDMNCRHGEESLRIVLDPAMIVHNVSGYCSDEDYAILGEGYYFYDTEPVMFDGLPAVAGIRYEPENDLVKEDYYYVLIAAEDGTFAELALNPRTLDLTLTAEHVIPSRSRIKTIYQAEDGYLLEDAEGRLWKTGTGVNLVSDEGIIKTVREKNRTGESQELKDLVSDEVWDRLELEVYPGGDGKEWE